MTKVYAIWKPSQIDAVAFINRNNLAASVVAVLPDDHPTKGLWVWVRMDEGDYFALRSVEPRLTVID